MEEESGITDVRRNKPPELDPSSGEIFRISRVGGERESASSVCEYGVQRRILVPILVRESEGSHMGGVEECFDRAIRRKKTRVDLRETRDGETDWDSGGLRSRVRGFGGSDGGCDR